MHLMVGIICIAATLIFHEGKPTCRVNGGRVVVTSFRMPMIDRLTVDWPQFAGLECRSGQGGHSFSGRYVRFGRSERYGSAQETEKDER